MSDLRSGAVALRVTDPVVDLLRNPEGARDRQLLYGEGVTLFEDRDGWGYVRAAKDGYVGYVARSALGAQVSSTHWVGTLATHVYRAADIKSPELCSLSFGSRVHVTSQSGDLSACAGGFVPSVHLEPLETLFSDPVCVAELFVGTPYLWGGNSRLGIDCSGLVQAALVACGHACPGDSGQQESQVGEFLPQNTAPERGDLLFWRGHVAIIVDRDTIIHANAHSMAVSSEPMVPAIQRIAAQGGGNVRAHKRLPV